MKKVLKVVVRKSQILKALPARKPTGNKTDYGKVKVWAGSPGFWGARILTARAAFRVGAGYVILESDKKDKLASELFLPEALTEKIQKPTPEFTYAVGPGLGVSLKTKRKIKELYKNKIPRVVLDADALTVIAKYNLPLREEWILTPHTGELSRLLKVPSALINKNREKYVTQAAKKYGCVVLLKGHHSLVAFKKSVYEIHTGNGALSKAGSGDVLTGMIAGLLAQKVNSLWAVISAAYIHGMIADEWIKKMDERGLTPSDLLLEIPRVMKKLNT